MYAASDKATFFNSSRRFAAVGIVLATTLTISSAWYYAHRTFAPRSVMTGQREYESIAQGMTEEDVVAVLGGPPGDYLPQGYAPVTASLGESFIPPGKVEAWDTIDGCVVVVFDSEGRAVYKNWSDVSPVGPSLIERILSRLGL